MKVRVVLDKSQRSEIYSSADFVVHAALPLSFIDAKHAIAHHKIVAEKRGEIGACYMETRLADSATP
jgi:hypothetical protein